jgi:hypothetical protein
MNTSSSSSTTATSRSAGSAEQPDVLIRGAGITAVAAVLFPRLNAVLHEGQAFWQLDSEAAVLIPVIVAVTVALFATVGRWAARPTPSNRAAAAGLGFGIAAVLGIAAFWVSAPIVFGGLAVALGVEGRRQAVVGQRRVGMAQVAMVLGTLGAVAGAVIWLIGT